MKGFSKILCLLLAICTLSGCGRKAKAPSKVVTGVKVTADSGYRIIRRHYTQPQNIQRVLNYLRLQEGQGFADIDPERLTGTSFVIDVTLSDGSHSYYYQRGSRYLSKKYHPWQKVDPDRAVDFYQMLQLTPTDT